MFSMYLPKTTMFSSPAVGRFFHGQYYEFGMALAEKSLD